jgi:GMP synthase (glutamine-hydrolysing)
MQPMKNATIIRHLAFEDLGSLAEALNQQDYALTYVEAGLESLAGIDPLTPDLVVIIKALCPLPCLNDKY